MTTFTVIPKTEKYDVFISYKWEIKENVEKIQQKLESVNISTWRDKNLQQNNDSLYLQLGKNIRNSQIFLCFLTKAYVKSAICIKEINFAVRIGKTIVYLMIERMTNEELTDEIAIIMGNSVYIQCYTNPKSWWDDNFEEIKSSIQLNLNKLKPPTSGKLENKRYKRLEKLGEGVDAFVYKCEDIEENDSLYRL